jgi:DNA-directed RNA polymerase subunit RPC12/RpoP
MRKLVRCPSCDSLVNQRLPDVSPFEADRLRADDNDTGVVVTCPHCQEKIWLKMRDLPNLPDAPP